MVLRSTYHHYLEAVERYFSSVFKILVPLQSSYGGPIIAFQIENELAESPLELEESRKYMLFLYNVSYLMIYQSLPFTPSLTPPPPANEASWCHGAAIHI